MYKMVEVVGFGNAIVDLTANLLDSSPQVVIPENCRGGFFRTTQAEFDYILSSLVAYKANSGGSVCNSLKAMSVLGTKCGFAGKVGKDIFANTFKANLAEYGIENYLAETGNDKTASTVVLVDENNEKSICGKMCASKNVKKEDIKLSLFAYAKLFFVEGYWLDHLSDVVKELINFASKNHILIAFTLSDPKIVYEQKDVLLDIFDKVDIWLGNDAEFEALGNVDFHGKIVAKTLGKNGVDIFYENQWQKFTALKVENIINTNGAGDAFAGGFLNGILNQYPLTQIVKQAQQCSVDVLQRAESTLSLNFRG